MAALTRVGVVQLHVLDGHQDHAGARAVGGIPKAADEVFAASGAVHVRQFAFHARTLCRSPLGQEAAHVVGF